MSKGYFVDALRERVRDDDGWAFYFVNGTNEPIESLVMTDVLCEWGDQGRSEGIRRDLGPVGLGESVLVFSDTSDIGEVNPNFYFIVRTASGTQKLSFELPKLYKVGPGRFEPD